MLPKRVVLPKAIKVGAAARNPLLNVSAWLIEIVNQACRLSLYSEFITKSPALGVILINNSGICVDRLMDRGSLA